MDMVVVNREKGSAKMLGARLPPALVTPGTLIDDAEIVCGNATPGGRAEISRSLLTHELPQFTPVRTNLAGP